MSVRLFFEIAMRPSVVRRALLLAVVVGTILIGINHGRCIMARKFDLICFLSSAVTVMVPYVVSTVSSVLACNASNQE